MVFAETKYELWVRTLRVWAKDPQTPLDDLPEIAEDEWSPDTWDRFLSHLQKALTSFSDAFMEEVQNVLIDSSLDELARNYHNLQKRYFPRFVLSQHKGLPPSLTEKLTQRAVEDLETIQNEVEKAVTKNTNRGSLIGENEILSIIKQNSLMQLAHQLQGGSITKLIPQYDPYKD